MFARLSSFRNFGSPAILLGFAFISLSTSGGCSRSSSPPAGMNSSPSNSAKPSSDGQPSGTKGIWVSHASSATELRVGSTAPLFSGLAHSGERISLEGLRGKVVVLYFYPKDGTPGCTTEAQEFRDSFPAFEAKNAVILGVSRDDASSHQEFATDEKLPFQLLPDTEGQLAQAYGVGSTFGFTQRVTFLIDREGKIAEVYRQVDPKTHADEVLRAIEAL